MLVYTCNLSTWDVEEDLEFKVVFGYLEFEYSLSYMKVYLKTK